MGLGEVEDCGGGGFRVVVGEINWSWGLPLLDELFSLMILNRSASRHIATAAVK